jgi:hypothetical protein
VSIEPARGTGAANDMRRANDLSHHSTQVSNASAQATATLYRQTMALGTLFALAAGLMWGLGVNGYRNSRSSWESRY